MLNEKKERYIIFALAGILLLIICIPVKGKQANGKTDLDKIINNRSYDTEAQVLQQAGGEQEVRSDSADAYRETLERELEELLGGMEGGRQGKGYDYAFLYRGGNRRKGQTDKPL